MAYKHWYSHRTANHVNEASDNDKPPTNTPKTPKNHASYVIAHSIDSEKHLISSEHYSIAEKGSIATPLRQSPTSFQAVSVVVAIALLIASSEISILILFAIRR
ncbi:hypothetical protein J056_004090 [Wallemia ichthyophaga EXF-994]|uniref:Uncharacterized protein n=1 Tax=Wallemia ichthyophaga (strain EXF-994 / CBS 113033) TaxID=1299270 RepID=R9AI15_WALI9|nr:uncharacterized protein J056_004090 [Wallemia ichthyophaga EXF-994]EOR01854.1 hypothetical protein J056_004090 [Wallemia ichthyophaga EXF-994]